MSRTGQTGIRGRGYPPSAAGLAAARRRGADGGRGERGRPGRGIGGSRVPDAAGGPEPGRVRGWPAEPPRRGRAWLRHDPRPGPGWSLRRRAAERGRAAADLRGPRRPGQPGPPGLRLPAGGAPRAAGHRAGDGKRRRLARDRGGGPLPAAAHPVRLRPGRLHVRDRRADRLRWPVRRHDRAGGGWPDHRAGRGGLRRCGGCGAGGAGRGGTRPDASRPAAAAPGRRARGRRRTSRGWPAAADRRG